MSHSETMRLFQYAAVRADIGIKYSSGFNPRQRLSLPLPKPVGVEAENDLLCIHIITQELSSSDIERIISKLSVQMPEGCSLLSGRLAESIPAPQKARYYFPIKQSEGSMLREEIQGAAERIMSADTVILTRQQDSKGFRIKDIDVRPFLDSVKFDDNGITVDCKVTYYGTIRVEEIMKMLGIEVEFLAAPVRRTNVQWQFERLNIQQDILEEETDAKRDVN